MVLLRIVEPAVSTPLIGCGLCTRRVFNQVRLYYWAVDRLFGVYHDKLYFGACDCITTDAGPARCGDYLGSNGPHEGERTGGLELWVWDGIGEPELFREIQGEQGRLKAFENWGSTPLAFVSWGDYLYFSAETRAWPEYANGAGYGPTIKVPPEVTGRELWRCGGSDEVTCSLAFDLAPGYMSNWPNDGYPEEMTAYDGGVYMSGRPNNPDSAERRELFKFVAPGDTANGVLCGAHTIQLTKWDTPACDMCPKDYGQERFGYQPQNLITAGGELCAAARLQLKRSPLRSHRAASSLATAVFFGALDVVTLAYLDVQVHVQFVDPYKRLPHEPGTTYDARKRKNQGYHPLACYERPDCGMKLMAYDGTTVAQADLGDEELNLRLPYFHSGQGGTFENIFVAVTTI